MMPQTTSHAFHSGTPRFEPHGLRHTRISDIGRFCCKTILGARAGNIDSRTATKAQHRFNKSFAPIRLLRVSRLLPSFATESAHAGKMNRSRKCLLLRGVKRTRFNASSLTRSRPWQKQELSRPPTSRGATDLLFDVAQPILAEEDFLADEEGR